MKFFKPVNKLLLLVLLIFLEAGYVLGTKGEKKNRIIVIHTGQQHGWGGWSGGHHKVIHHHHGHGHGGGGGGWGGWSGWGHGGGWSHGGWGGW